MARMGRREKAKFLEVVAVTLQRPRVAVDLLLAVVVHALKIKHHEALETCAQRNNSLLVGPRL